MRRKGLTSEATLLREAITLLGQAEHILVFTGAGISTRSGIPDFRGPEGLWNRWRPVYFDEFLRSHEARVRHWEYKLQSWERFRDAQPNAAHRALVEIDQKRALIGLVTQNIDGLHQLAGHDPSRVIELHGTNRLVECLACGRRSNPEAAFASFRENRRPPVCPCGGLLKPATVSFGQSMPEGQLARAFQLAEACDLVFTIGSSLEVEPAASVPRRARASGAHYIILNLGPTSHDSLADLCLEGDAAELLPQIAAGLSVRRSASQSAPPG